MNSVPHFVWMQPKQVCVGCDPLWQVAEHSFEQPVWQVQRKRFCASVSEPAQGGSCAPWRICPHLAHAGPPPVLLELVVEPAPPPQTAPHCAEHAAQVQS